MIKFPNVFFKRARNTWWARWGTVSLCDESLDTLSELITYALEKGYE